MVHIHNQLFGSNNLVLAVSYLHIFTGDLLEVLSLIMLIFGWSLMVNMQHFTLYLSHSSCEVALIIWFKFHLLKLRLEILNQQISK